MSQNEYPKWKYAAGKPGVIVNDRDEEEGLGLGWHDEPQAALDEPGDADNVGPTGDEVFDAWAEENGAALLPDSTKAIVMAAFYRDQGVVESGAQEKAADEAEAERQALLQEAKDLGLGIHHMTGTAKIKAAIEAYKAESQE